MTKLWEWPRRVSSRIENAQDDAKRASAHRERVAAQWPIVRSIVGETRHQRERNGFTEIILAVAQGRERPL